MTSRYFRLLCASALYFSLGCFWIRYNFVNGGSWLLGVVMLGTGSAVGGLLQERFDSVRVGLVGAALFGLGFVATGLTSSPAWHYLTLEILIGFGSGLAYSTGIPLVARWFPDKLGLGVGVAVAGYVPASFIGGGAVRALIGLIGGPRAAVVTGIALFVIPACALALLRDAPRQALRSEGEGHTPSEMLKAASFLPLGVSYTLACTAAMMVYHTLPGYLSELAVEPARAAFIVGLLGPVGSAANASARVLAGWLCDTAGGLRSLFVVLVLIPLAALIAPILWPPEALLAVQLAALAGYGGTLAIYPFLTAQLFGAKHLAANYGIVFNGWAIGYIAGGLLAPLTVRLFGLQSAGFYGAAIVSIVAMSIAFFPASTRTLLRQPILEPIRRSM